MKVGSESAFSSNCFTLDRPFHSLRKRIGPEVRTLEPIAFQRDLSFEVEPCRLRQPDRRPRWTALGPSNTTRRPKYGLTVFEFTS
jgi:hypothetical protein